MIEAVVVKKICDNTVKVYVEKTNRHLLYGKVVKKKKFYLVQNNGVDVGDGDKVLIALSRPFSKKKKHILFKKVV